MLSALLSVLPTATLIRWTARSLFLPFYHLVAEDPVPHVANLYEYRNIAAFEADLDFIVKHFIPVTLEDVLVAVTQGQRFPRPAFHITFDDGMRQVFDIAAPILVRRGIPATLFVNSAFLDNRSLFYRHKASLLIDAISKHALSPSTAREVASVLGVTTLGVRDVALAIRRISYRNRFILELLAPLVQVDFAGYLSTMKPYMTTEQLHGLHRKGFTIGAHSIDHPDFKSLSLEEQLRQTRDSVGFLAKEFDLRHKAFAFPFSDAGVSRSYFDVAFAPSAPIIDVSFGVFGFRNDYHSRHLQRLQMDGTCSSVSYVINKECLACLGRSILDKNRVDRAD